MSQQNPVYQKLEKIQVPVNQWMDKTNYGPSIHTVEYYSTTKKKGQTGRCYNLEETQYYAK